jgi:hypothetical protein
VAERGVRAASLEEAVLAVWKPTSEPVSARHHGVSLNVDLPVHADPRLAKLRLIDRASNSCAGRGPVSYGTARTDWRDVTLVTLRLAITQVKKKMNPT